MATARTPRQRQRPQPNRSSKMIFTLGKINLLYLLFYTLLWLLLIVDFPRTDKYYFFSGSSAPKRNRRNCSLDPGHQISHQRHLRFKNLMKLALPLILSIPYQFYINKSIFTNPALLICMYQFSRLFLIKSSNR